MAVGGRGGEWYVVNVTPDIRMQIESTAALRPRQLGRNTPISAILLSDAELDYTLGLLELRENSPLTVYASQTVLGALCDAMPVQRVLRPYTEIAWRTLDPDRPLELAGKLMVESLTVGHKPPRYAAAEGNGTTWVLAYRFTDGNGGASVVYAPVVERWTQALQDFMSGADWVFFDGTFWAQDDVRVAAGRPLSAQEGGHLQISGEGGSAERLSSVQATRKVYVHINNTNPILDEPSPERARLAALGFEVGE